MNEWLAASADRPRLIEALELPQARALFATLVDHSPYLWRLSVADPSRLEWLLWTPPGEAFEICLADLAAACASRQASPPPWGTCARPKPWVALLVALADVGGVWSLKDVVGALTRFADTAVAGALACLLRDAVAAGRLNADPFRVEERCGMTVLALGKAGGGELNYSSDIDLVVLFDPSAAVLAPGQGCFALLCPFDPATRAHALRADRRGLCVPRRPAAASRSRLDRGRDLAAGCLPLLRILRAELGTGGFHQGSPHRPATRSSARRFWPTSSPSSGANISTMRRSPISTP